MTDTPTNSNFTTQLLLPDLGHGSGRALPSPHPPPRGGGEGNKLTGLAPSIGPAGKNQCSRITKFVTTLLATLAFGYRWRPCDSFADVTGSLTKATLPKAALPASCLHRPGRAFAYGRGLGSVKIDLVWVRALHFGLRFE